MRPDAGVVPVDVERRVVMPVVVIMPMGMIVIMAMVVIMTVRVSFEIGRAHV